MIPSVLGALFGALVRTAFSISGIMISGDSIGSGYSYPLISDRSAKTGSGKKDWRSSSAFSSG